MTYLPSRKTEDTAVAQHFYTPMCSISPRPSLHAIQEDKVNIKFKNPKPVLEIQFYVEQYLLKSLKTDLSFSIWEINLCGMIPVLV